MMQGTHNVKKNIFDHREIKQEGEEQKKKNSCDVRMEKK